MRVSRFVLLTVLAMGVVTVSDSGKPLFAQNGLPQNTLDRDSTALVKPANQPPSLATLKTGLDAVYWDAGQRGPIIAVAAETIQPAWQTNGKTLVLGPGGYYFPAEPPQTPELLPGRRYRATDLAVYFTLDVK